MKLDDVHVGVRAGDGIVARLADAVLVVPFGAQVEQAAVDRLIEAARDGPVAGRLEDLRAAAGAGVQTFAIVAEVGESFGVFAEGDASIGIAGGEPLLRLAGRGVDGWSLRVPAGFGSLEVGDVDGSPVDPRLDLRAGVVPGVGVVLSPKAGVNPVAVPAVASSPPPSGPEPVALAPEPAAVAGPVEVWGIRCKKGHFNNPEARYCGLCGIHMVQDKAARVKGVRPVLGFLVFDDGMSFKLDTDYVLGSDPHGHDAVTTGQARPLVVSSADGVVSAVHARVVLRDWDAFVSDCGSVYGTHVWSPGATDWQRLAPDDEVKLGTGSQVLLAQRGFMFQPVNKR